MGDLIFYLVYYLFFIENASQGNAGIGDLQMAKEIKRMFCADKSPMDTSLNTLEFLNLPVKPSTSLSCCEYCSKDKMNCILENNCCLEAFEELPTIDESKTMVQRICDYPQLKPYTLLQANALHAVNVIRHCPERSYGRIPDDIITRCEMKSMKLFDLIPETDTFTLYTYRNKYCAMCHTVPEERLLRWSASVMCYSDSMPLGSIDDIVNDVMKYSSCNLIFAIDPNTRTPWDDECVADVISTCNQTGHWKTYDSFERACLAYTKIYNKAYRNVFCYVCNTNDTVSPRRCLFDEPPIIYYSFSAVINPKLYADNHSRTAAEVRQCRHDETFDYIMETCLRIRCQFPKTYFDGVCVNMAGNIEGDIFDVYFEMTPPHFISITSVAYSIPEIIVSEIVKYGLRKDHVTVQTLVLTTERGVDAIPDRIIFYVQMAFAENYPASLIDDILAINNMSIKLSPTPLVWIHATATLSHWYRGSQNIIDIRSGTILNTQTSNKSMPPEFETDKRRRVPATYHLTKFSNCPYVSIDDAVVYTNAASKEQVFVFPHGIYVHHNDIFISSLSANNSWNDTEFHNVSIYMCVENFESMTKKTIYVNTNNNLVKDYDGIIIILSFFCIVLSMLSALCTFLIYCKFNELRTQPGINNMILALYVLITQALFQFGYGSSEDVSTITCKIIGVCLHFAWLAFAMWMNVCCIHTFRVFKSTRLHSRDNNKLRVTSVYTLYCWLIASLPIVIHIVKSFIESDGQGIGYGGDVCYLSPVEHVVYLVTIPIICIVIVDLILYAVVVVQIKKASGHFEYHAETQNLMMVYLRLSTITGGTWILAVVYIFTNAIWAEYLFVVFNASQGIFLFFAFVVNRRVLRRMASSCRRKCSSRKYSGASSKVKSTSDRSNSKKNIIGEKRLKPTATRATKETQNTNETHTTVINK